MKISFKWIGGATWILQIDNLKIACDPVLCPADTIQDYKYFKTKRLNDPVYNDSDFQKVNLWLLTHNHEDHIDRAGFKIINKDAIVISHTGCRKYFKKNIFKDVRLLNWNEESAFAYDDIRIKIKALPAIHAKRKLYSSIIGNGNGYFLEISKKDSKFNIYVTGDSVYNKSFLKHFSIKDIDLIIANAGSAMVGKSFLSVIIGRITNNINDIIKMNSDLKPEILIPVHWGTFSHYSEVITEDKIKEYSNIKFLNAGESIDLKQD